MNEKLQRQRKEKPYEQNLDADANNLGISVHTLEEVLHRKMKVTVKARKLFHELLSKQPIPKCQWKDMPDDIVSKEKALVGRTTIWQLIKLK